MKKGWKLALISTFLLSIISVVIPMSNVVSSANSAPAFWFGVDGNGAIVLDKNCPLEVDYEKLVFCIEEFPQTHYSTEDQTSFESYSATVTANYTFYNPANYTVQARLAFPFGEKPSYMDIYDSESEEYESKSDLEDCIITLNNTEIPRKVRYSFLRGTFSQNVEEELLKLHDDYLEDSFYRPDMQVTKYVYECSGLEYSSAQVGLLYQGDPSQSRVWFAFNSSYQARLDGAKIKATVKNGQKLEVYVFGKPLINSLDWNFFRRVSDESGVKEVPIQGNIQLDSQKMMTLEEFLFNAYDERGAESEEIGVVDWYNASILSLRESEREPDGVIYLYDSQLKNRLLRWYEYEIEVPPNATVTNSVTAPVYPLINAEYEPEVYTYTYFISPAKSWPKFGALDIEIHTPFYLLKDGDEFAKTEFGYALSLDGLPDGELQFSLSKAENPKSKNNFLTGCGYAFLYLLCIPELLIGELIYGCNATIGTMLGVTTPILMVATALLIKKR